MSETMSLEEYKKEIRQNDLPGIKSRVGSGGRGKAFENEVDNTNADYYNRNLAVVTKNEKTWTTCSHRDRQRLLDKQIYFATALTDTGYPLLARKSKPDFEGLISGGRHVFKRESRYKH